MSMNEPNGDATVTKTYLTGDAVKFELIGPGTAAIERGAEAKLTVVMPATEQSHIEVKLDGDSLKVSHHGGLLRHREPDGPLRYDLSVPLLSELKLSGGLAAEAANIEGRDLTIELKEGSSLTLAQVRATEIDAKVSAGSRLGASGGVSKLRLKLSDGSAFQGGSLDAEEVEIDATSGSEATTRPSRSLKVKATGGSTIAYGGDKLDLNVQTTDGAVLSHLSV